MDSTTSSTPLTDGKVTSNGSVCNGHINKVTSNGSVCNGHINKVTSNGSVCNGHKQARPLITPVPTFSIDQPQPESSDTWKRAAVFIAIDVLLLELLAPVCWSLVQHYRLKRNDNTTSTSEGPALLLEDAPFCLPCREVYLTEDAAAQNRYKVKQQWDEREGMMLCCAESHDNLNRLVGEMYNRAQYRRKRARGTSAEPDPCLYGYTTRNETKRSSGYVLADGEDPLSDSTLPLGWYRFTSAAGGMMPESCVERFHCGTIVPAWLNGSHPKKDHEEAAMQVCLNYNGNDPSKKCCEHSTYVGVKNCGDFYLYYLKPMAFPDMAYCAGDKMPCGKGKGSPTGFYPCEEVYPVLDDSNDPVLSGPEVQNHAFRFKCDVNIPAHDPDLMFEIEWTFDGKSDPTIPNKILNNRQRAAYLYGTALAGHMGQDVGCRVRSWYKNRQVIQKSPWKDSNPYLVDVRIDPGRVEVSEKGGNATVTLTSTVPVICDHNKTCCISFTLDADGPRDNMVVSNPCQHQLCSSDWDPNTKTVHTKFTVLAAKDNILDRDNYMLLSFQTLQPGAGGPFLNIFHNYTLPTVQVDVKDAPTYVCSWSGDPHFHGFTRNKFDLLDVGDFTVYENKRDNFEIQSRNIRCGRSASCQCGLAIREHQDVIRIENCHHPSHAPSIVTTGNLRTGTRIHRTSDGRHIIVYLPSGREVKVDLGWHQSHTVSVTVPPSDEDHGRGICGTLDADKYNEFMHKDGYVDQSQCQGRRHCVPINFLISWKNNHTTSLFETKPADLNIPKKDQHYCQCDKDSNGINRINCTAGADVTHTAQRCSSRNCHDVTSTLPAILQGFGFGWARRSAAYEDMDEPDPPLDFTPISPSSWNPQWPTASGITEHQAEIRCRHEIQQAQLYSHCRTSNQLIDSVIEDCVTDILLLDSFDMVESAVMAFTSGCQFDLIQDPTNYVTDVNGNRVLKDSIVDICSMSCLRHGTCVNGNCVCHPGYTGEHCQLQENTPPTLSRVRGSSFCDLNRRPCRLIYLDADHFEMTDSLKCKVDTIVPNGQATHHAEDKAQIISGARLACPLPDSSKHAKTEFSVSLTMDGRTYSAALPVTTFDSSCMSCDSQGCKQLAGTCIIDNRCYQDNDRKPGDTTKVCDASASVSSWTNVPGAAFPVIAIPTISGPDLGLMISCNVHSTSHNPRARFEVTWYVDDATEVGKQTLAADERTAFKSVTQLPPSAGKVYCKVRSFYEGSSVFSQYMASSSVSLMTVKGTRNH